MVLRRPRNLLLMPPVVASTTLCMHNNQVPAGRELGFRKTFLMVPGSATRVGSPDLELILHQTMEPDLMQTEAFTA